MTARFARTSALLVAVTALPVVGAEPAPDAERWLVQAGRSLVQFDEAALARHGVLVGQPGGIGVPLPDASARQLIIKHDSTLTFEVVGGALGSVQGGSIAHLGDLVLTSPSGRIVLDDLAVAPVGDGAASALWTAAPRTGPGNLLLGRVKTGFDAASTTLTIRSGELRLSPALAQALGAPALAEVPIGSVTTSAVAAWIGGAAPQTGAGWPVPAGAPGSVAGLGGDMTFCQLYGLYMPGGSRIGAVTGLALATTSWNIGTADMMWFAIPNEEHPFIVMNLYRLKNERFEQIGQSHIKHGFYALGSHQCGGPPCTYEPGHSSGNWLGQNCTDTYGASLNAVQSGMGPRYEVDPWSGYWFYPGSHMSVNHSHDAITHRLQVNDADLDPAQNQGATYYAEGYYVMLDDPNVLNSTSWKQVTITGGAPGGLWTFGMSGAATYPNIGFALDAWVGATQTLFAEEIPVIEFQSPDGRCILAAKVKDLGGGTWHYEYALLNIDMDKQVGAFTVPVPTAATITNVGFHAVAHHSEPFNTADPDRVAIDNAPWSYLVGAGTVQWVTTTNPLRWGTLYNFRFDADMPPGTVVAELTAFRGGEAAPVLAGTTVGPVGPPCPGDVDGDGSVGVTDFLALLAAWGPNPGHPADLDGDGIVDVTDFLALLAAWGPCTG